ncbi:MAG: IS200/IS605 family transposase [Anaerolineae bacterium]|jgi:putative transposase|nr:IS200/IS605 family transposase [Anaerolineae bacterium]MBT7191954.1 IS200/IS605 family transposase [Anaerolineae bacterium]MBT7988613.1 IS200/IS605 family transposase [Anaerolineae bacterium]
MTYWRLHYHLIWGTFERQPLLTGEGEKVFYGVVYNKAKELGIKIHAAGNVDDHAHIVCSIPPRLSVAEVVRQLKGASSFAINKLNDGGEKFQWQAGYGALSVSERNLEQVMAYAIKQKEHHRNDKIMPVYEKIDSEED